MNGGGPHLLILNKTKMSIREQIELNCGSVPWRDSNMRHS